MFLYEVKFSAVSRDLWGFRVFNVAFKNTGDLFAWIKVDDSGIAWETVPRLVLGIVILDDFVVHMLAHALHENPHPLVAVFEMEHSILFTMRFHLFSKMFWKPIIYSRAIFSVHWVSYRPAKGLIVPKLAQLVVTCKMGEIWWNLIEGRHWVHTYFIFG